MKVLHLTLTRVTGPCWIRPGPQALRVLQGRLARQALRALQVPPALRGRLVLRVFLGPPVPLARGALLDRQDPSVLSARWGLRVLLVCAE